ncbi:MAG: replication-associated recombination protein A, partial [Myxococcota bacterium]
MTDDLFQRAARADAPLAERMRPRRLSEVRGQAHLVGPGQLFSRVVKADRLPSMILWGPP